MKGGKPDKFAQMMTILDVKDHELINQTVDFTSYFRDLLRANWKGGCPKEDYKVNGKPWY